MVARLAETVVLAYTIQCVDISRLVQRMQRHWGMKTRVVVIRIAHLVGGSDKGQVVVVGG